MWIEKNDSQPRSSTTRRAGENRAQGCTPYIPELAQTLRQRQTEKRIAAERPRRNGTFLRFTRTPCSWARRKREARWRSWLQERERESEGERERKKAVRTRAKAAKTERTHCCHVKTIWRLLRDLCVACWRKTKRVDPHHACL